MTDHDTPEATAESIAESRLQQLLTDAALGDQTVDAAAELHQSLLALATVHDPASTLQTAAEYEQIIGALQLACVEANPEPLPAALANRIRRESTKHVSDRRPVANAMRPDLAGRPRRTWLDGVAPGLVAAAIMLLVTTTIGPLVLPPQQQNNQQAGVKPPVIPAELSLAEQRAALLATATDVITLPWSTTEDPAVAAAHATKSTVGDVVWSPGEQRGFMRFAGLEANDPARAQYQLWIFDANRNEAYPVDGGVFDVPAGTGETIVPIRARLPIQTATLFAVTVEKPGGVVVSDRSRLPVLAKVPTSNG